MSPAAVSLDEVLWKLEDSRIRSRLSVELFSTAATLAAEQVQDKQLELSQQPAEATPGETVVALFTSLLSVAMVATGAGVVVQGATLSILRGILRSRRAFSVLPKSASGYEVLSKVLAADVGADLDSLAVRELLAVKRVEKLYDNVLVRAVETAPAVARKSFEALKRINELNRDAEPLSGGDSARVAFLDLIQQFHSTQSAMVEADHANLRIELMRLRKNEDFVKSVSTMLDQVLGTFPDEVAMHALKDEYKRLFEATIWMRIYGDTPIQFALTRRSGSFGELIGELENVPAVLTRYWIRRFYHPESDREYGQRLSFLAYYSVETPRASIETLERHAILALSRHLMEIQDELRRGAAVPNQGIFRLTRPAIPRT